jgi:F-type H+-transporting ATPase subunit delta
MSVAANRYAKALIDVLYPNNKAEDGIQQLQKFAALLSDQPEARQFFENPAMAGDRRKRLLKEISSALVFDRRVANFVQILVDRNRLPLLAEIVKAYQKNLDERQGIVRAQVTAAHTLDASEQRELRTKLEQMTGKQVRMEVAVDPSIIGGLIAQVGSTIYDGSVRHQLRAFKSRLVED